MDGLHLQWEDGDYGAVLEIGAAPQTATSAFVFRGSDGRLDVGMALLPTSRVVDVARQPAVFGQVLPVAAGGCPAGTCGSIVARWVTRAAERRSTWHPEDPDDLGLVGTVGGCALPLLGATYDRGARPLTEVPRWAVPVLAATTARAGAVAVFGARATRPVVSALATGLTGTGPTRTEDGDGDGDGADARPQVGLFPLALALMGAAVLESDRLARVLRPGADDPGPRRWPDSGQIAAFRRLAPVLGPARTERLLTEAAARPDGPELLAGVTATAPQVAHLLPRRIAGRLEDLLHQCREHLPVDPCPRTERWGPLPARAAPRAPARRRPPEVARPRMIVERRVAPPRPAPVTPAPRPTDPRRRALNPPPAPVPTTGDGTSFRFPAMIDGLHGTTCGDDLRLTVPRTVAELTAWGARLGNCLGNYGRAAAANRSFPIGIERHGRLVYCVELQPDRTIRQFLGSRNRPVPAEHASAVVAHLVSSGVLASGHPANRVWTAPDGGRPD